MGLWTLLPEVNPLAKFFGAVLYSAPLMGGAVIGLFRYDAIPAASWPLRATLTFTRAFNANRVITLT